MKPSMILLEEFVKRLNIYLHLLMYVLIHSESSRLPLAVD